MSVSSLGEPRASIRVIVDSDEAIHKGVLERRRIDQTEQSQEKLDKPQLIKLMEKTSKVFKQIKPNSNYASILEVYRFAKMARSQVDDLAWIARQREYPAGSKEPAKPIEDFKTEYIQLFDSQIASLGDRLDSIESWCGIS